ncbi:MAG: S-adenosyl-L-methionine-dependent methyltransferase [Monoraphidium minutum]|nr:MAG: S-adenosyl-L-methionine-dependent methyltransferase [Monoraphidium minutum]
MSMFAYMALSPADQASLAAASPAPMRGSRPLVTRRVVDALLARLGMTADQVRRGVELGCGSGRLCRLAAGLLPNAEIIGVDASPYMVAAANAEEMMWSPEEAVDPRRVRFIAALAEDTGLEAGSCDFVMVPFVAHELPHAARLAFLSEARRLLRPGGAVAFIDHRQDGLEHTVFHKLKDSAPLLGDAFHWLVNIGAPEPFLREYHEHRMQDSFLQAGFEGGGPEGFVAVTRWQKAMIATKPLA